MLKKVRRVQSSELEKSSSAKKFAKIHIARLSPIPKKYLLASDFVSLSRARRPGTTTRKATTHVRISIMIIVTLVVKVYKQ
jgi:hypothetical protein